MSVGRARRRNRRAAHGASHPSHKGAGKHPDENRFEQQNRGVSSLACGKAIWRLPLESPQRVVAVDASGTPGQTHPADCGV